ncbi:MAG TPA: DUF2891 domain-containing protein [Phycisphaerales bacterium]|nr:DUF2891 domain-containing protein [Phycisphaerales bacterium]
MPTRTPDNIIDHFVEVVLAHIDREFPNKLDHVMNDAAEIKSPRDLHPIFYGSFDWHSSVHGHWLLVRALRTYPTLARAADVRTLLDARFTPENVRAEVAYLGRPLRATFERTYGWAWLLKLAAELKLGAAAGAGAGGGASKTDDETRAACARWDRILAPLALAFAKRFMTYLPKATYPIRVGTHQNSAFGLALALDYAAAAGDKPLTDLIGQKARAWYAADANCPAWEPDGIDFLSPALMEAECMRRVLPAPEFVPWLDRFLPNLAARQPATLFLPATVSDRTDGQITHLDGLNLSRAWCWRRLGQVVPESDPRRALAEKAYQTHLDAALPHVTGDYMGEHWLATFALLAMTE